MCYGLAPAVFVDDEQGFGLVRSPHPTGHDAVLAEEAVSACPERAIFVKPPEGPVRP